MYKSFILPHFDYADVVWDNCTDKLSNMLENLHLEGIRIILGAVRGTSHQKLYEESGFCTLKERRRRHKLILFHKMVNGVCPDYLSDLLPPLVSTRNPYHRRRPLERVIPPHKTDIYQKSFIPSTTMLWNSIPENIKQSTSISELKRYLSISDTTVPPYYYKGKRKEQITHCRLRLEMSNLNYDLKKRHLTADPACTCGYPYETAEHYLLYCPKYTVIRKGTISTLHNSHTNIDTLLRGNSNLQQQENENIFA
ncbi:hypothetical protein, partial [Thiolapillus sp.]